MNSDILIYQNQEGNIKIDVRLEEETVWLTQSQICELFQKSKATVSEHINNIFKEGELIQNSVVRNFRTTAADGETMAQQQTPMYMNDWIQRLDSILQLNGLELLTRAGKISHEMALEKSENELEKYKSTQKALEKEQSLKELEQDLKQLKPK